MGEISKLSASIGSCSISSAHFSVLKVDKPSGYKWEEVESALKSVLNPEELECFEEKISFTQASRSRGV